MHEQACANAHLNVTEGRKHLHALHMKFSQTEFTETPLHPVLSYSVLSGGYGCKFDEFVEMLCKNQAQGFERKSTSRHQGLTFDYCIQFPDDHPITQRTRASKKPPRPISPSFEPTWGQPYDRPKLGTLRIVCTGR